MQATQIVLIRHGQTDWNLQRRIQGSSDISLNELGLAQARATRDALANEHFDVVYSSHLDRAKVTASTINEAHALEHRIREGLTERAHGDAEGANVEETMTRWPNFVGIPGLESWLEVQTRMMLTFREIATDFAGKRALVVSHGSAIRAAIGDIRGEEPRSVKSQWNCAVNRLTHHSGDGWTVDVFNDNSHLPQELRT